MKTVLPKRILTEQEAKDFLTELYKNGEAYHPEDDAYGILHNATEEFMFTDEEADLLNSLMEDCRNLPGNFDACDFLLNLQNL